MQKRPSRVIVSDMPLFGCSPINNDNCGLMSICVSPPTVKKKKSVMSRNLLNWRYLPNHHSDMNRRVSEFLTTQQDKKSPFSDMDRRRKTIFLRHFFCPVQCCPDNDYATTLRFFALSSYRNKLFDISGFQHFAHRNDLLVYHKGGH